MKALYNNHTTLQTETRVRLEANYNRTIFGMSRPGEVLYYRAPSDPAEHPMYVDSEGRIVPVSPTTLQPMTNANGNLVDKNGVLLPVGEVSGILPHIDDVRVAVTSADYEVTDEEGKEIFIAHDGQIIPTNDDGVPGTTVVNGVVWAIGKDGQPHAPLSRVFPLRSYVKPVRAENVPASKNGTFTGLVDDEWPEYFDISHIVKADRPKRRGALISWTSADEYDSPVMTGQHSYDKPRFYAASEDMQYKYWTSPNTSSANGTVTGDSLAAFDATWTTVGVSNRDNSIAGQIAGDITNTNAKAYNTYWEKVLTLEPDTGYELSFDVLTQADVLIDVELLEWSDDQGTTPNYNSASLIRKAMVGSSRAGAGTVVTVTTDLDPAPYTRTHAIRIHTRRYRAADPKRITLSNFSLKRADYPITGVGPRAVYDRPVKANKIVIGVDYSVDESVSTVGSVSNKPADHRVRVYADRGDGLFTWTTVAIDPEIDEDGKITLYFDGANWGDTPNYEATKEIMGVQYHVYDMRRRDARVNITEISARRVYDVSDLLMNYDVNSDVSDDSFVLPFGTVNTNNGKIELSNHDGRFNHDNRYLLNRSKTGPLPGEVFTTVENPFYKMLGESLYVEVETATFLPGDTERNFVRMITGRTEPDFAPGNSMSATFNIVDDSALLQGIIPDSVFYFGSTMSIIQVLYMLLDSVGFTNVRFSDEDEHFSTHLGYFWTTKDNQNIWEIIADVCRATQTVAFFDEYNVLHFKSLKGLYEDALSRRPAQVFTTEDVPGTLANISDLSLENSVAVNKVNLNYRDVSAPEKTPSGNTPMAIVWEPEGTEVVRGAYMMKNLDNKRHDKGGSTQMQIPADAAKTWPFSGMVQVEGEFIRYDAKQYKYIGADEKWRYRWVTNDDQRKNLDKKNEYRAFENTYTGNLRISERGAEDTMIRAHKISTLDDYTRRFKDGSKAIKDNYKRGISIKNSRLNIERQDGTSTQGITSITHGHAQAYRPVHMGSRFRIDLGAGAGVCFGMSSNDDGIFVELQTTQSLEAAGRPRGELHVFVRNGGKIKFYTPSADVPVSRRKDYSLDVTVRDGAMPRANRLDYSKYYNVVLRYGNRGSNVKVLQQALNKKGEKLTVDGSFGNATRNAVIRLQRKNNLTRDAIVRQEEWVSLETPHFNFNYISIAASVDGVFSQTITIPKSELPTGWNGGRFGVFTRARTTASFEYLYGVRGSEDIEFDESNFFDYIEGGFVSDQLDAGWIYSKKNRWVTSGGKKVLRKVINSQLFIDDFGPYAHEVKDYEVVFKDDQPAMSSYLYFSNENAALVTDYKHSPFGAKFRIVNKARRDAILNGEDTVTFGSENSVDQKLMIYGSVLNVNDERTITVTDKTSVDSRGIEELSIDVDWLQSEESAKKLGSHIVEAMSHPVPTYDVDIFGNASVKVGQIVALCDPTSGIGDIADPENANRYFVYSATHSNDGAHSTSLGLREVIGSTGHRKTRLKDVLAANNNAANMNPDIEGYERVNGVYRPKGYSFRNGLKMSYVSPTTSTMRGGGAVKITGTGATPYLSSMLLQPYPSGVGRFAHTYGHYFIFTAEVTANHDIAVGLALEGWATTSSMIKVLASRAMKLKKGETKTITLKGQFLADGDIPELQPVIRALDPANTANGAPNNKALTVNSAFFRMSQDADSIYPLHGGANLRNI